MTAPANRRAAQKRYESSPKGKEMRRIARLRRYHANPEKALAVTNRNRKLREIHNPLRGFAFRLKKNLLKRCRKKGFPITAELQSVDFYLKELRRHIIDGQPSCPCCNKPFEFDTQKLLPSDRTPSCDRIDAGNPSYATNIAIICWRCNRIKQDASSQELLSIALWLQRHGK